MALPKRKHSKARTRTERTHHKLIRPLLVECKECRKLKVAHQVCPFCGHYAGREVVKIEFKEKIKKFLIEVLDEMTFRREMEEVEEEKEGKKEMKKKEVTKGIYAGWAVAQILNELDYQYDERKNKEENK